MRCEPCSLTLTPDDRLCPNCGNTNLKQEMVIPNQSPDKDIELSRVANHKTHIEFMKFSKVFSHVFVKHSEEDAEKLLLIGTSQTTPNIVEVSDSYPRPWLFSRIFLFIGLLYIGLFIGFEIFDNVNFFTGLITAVSFLVPLTILTFFWEMNVPQNISIYKIIKISFIGGVLSLVTAVFFYEINTNVLLIGLIEDVAKLFVILWFIKGTKYNFILNGILVGGAVGTGCAISESVSYVLMQEVFKDPETMYATIFWQGSLAPVGHIMWSALLGAALSIVKDDRAFRLSMLMDMHFIKIFVVVVVMHAVWDFPWSNILGLHIAQLFLTIFTWIIVSKVMRIGLKEVSNIKKLYNHQIGLNFNKRPVEKVHPDSENFSRVSEISKKLEDELEAIYMNVKDIAISGRNERTRRIQQVLDAIENHVE